MLDECVIINVSKVFCVTCDGRTENWETKILVCSVCGWLRHCSVSADGLSMLSVDGLIKTVWHLGGWSRLSTSFELHRDIPCNVVLVSSPWYYINRHTTQSNEHQHFLFLTCPQCSNQKNISFFLGASASFRCKLLMREKAVGVGFRRSKIKSTTCVISLIPPTATRFNWTAAALHAMDCGLCPFGPLPRPRHRRQLPVTLFQARSEVTVTLWLRGTFVRACVCAHREERNFLSRLTATSAPAWRGQVAAGSVVWWHSRVAPSVLRRAVDILAFTRQGY